MLSDKLREEYAPGWWLDRLDKKLCKRARRIAGYERYYAGDHPLLFATEKFREAFGTLFAPFSDNWCGTVVDAVEERLDVEGFRLGADIAGDKEAWAMWQANRLDADSQMAHTEALVNEVSYGLVWPSDGKWPEITVEHPLQTIVEFEAGSRRKRAAGLKKWLDDDGYMYATVYLPDAIYKFRSTQKRKDASSPLNASSWQERPVPESQSWEVKHPFGVVPIVPLVNRPHFNGDGRSEIADVIPIQDAVNKLVADMLVASEYAAFRQRYVTGMDLPVDPDTNQPIEPFKISVDKLLVAEEEGAQFGSFEVTDLENYVKGIEMLVQHAASISRTPPHYLNTMSGQWPAGEAIKSSEAGLVAKARRKQRHFGEAWEEIMRLGFVALGRKRKAAILDSETIWGDPEYRTEGEHVDALLKLKALGVPLQQLWQDANYSPQQTERFPAMHRELAAMGLSGIYDAKPTNSEQPPAPAAE